MVVKLPADKFGDWENAAFAPEELNDLRMTKGIKCMGIVGDFVGNLLGYSRFLCF